MAGKHIQSRAVHAADRDGGERPVRSGVTADGQVFIQVARAEPALLTAEDAAKLAHHLVEDIELAARVRNTPKARP